MTLIYADYAPSTHEADLVEAAFGAAATSVEEGADRGDSPVFDRGRDRA